MHLVTFKHWYLQSVHKEKHFRNREVKSRHFYPPPTTKKICLLGWTVHVLCTEQT